jgi:hypothetical protein
MIAGTMTRKPKKDIGDLVGDVAKALGKAAAKEPLIAQNIKYYKAVKAGPTAVAKTAAVDLAVGAASAAAGKVLGSVVSRVGSRAAASAGEYVADKSFDVLSAPLQKSSSGGRLFNVQTPFGKTLGSTKIMNAAQRQAAISGLTSAAANRATEIGSAVASDLSAAARAAASGIRAAAGPLGVAAVNRKRGGGKNKK